MKRLKTLPNVLKLLSQINYLLGKGDYVVGCVGLTVCESVCLSFSNITQKVMNRLQCNFMEESGEVK